MQNSRRSTAQAQHNEGPNVRRRTLLGMGAAAASGLVPALSQNASAVQRSLQTVVEVENLGAGVQGFPVMSGVLVGDTMYAGSRNLSPARVAAFHVPTGAVTSTLTLGDGDFVQGMAADGADSIYAGVTNTQQGPNLYHVDLGTDEVSAIAFVPGIFIRTVAVAPDHMVYFSGRADEPPVYSYDPETSEINTVAVPEPQAHQSLALAATETTVYYGCGSALDGGGDASRAGLFAIDRASGEVTDLLPPALAGGEEVQEIAVLDDLLVVIVKGFPWRLGVLDLANGGWHVVEISSLAVARSGDDLIISTTNGLSVLDLNTWTLTHLGGSFGRAWGMGLTDNLVVGAAGSGTIWTFDLASGDSTESDLIDAGGAGDPLNVMSVAAGGGRCYVSGTNNLAIHDPAAGTVEQIAFGGEVKDMIAVGDTMYMGVYSGRGVWAHGIGDTGAPWQVAELPAEQNRPMVIRWDEVNELLAVGVKADAVGGGSLCVVDPATGAVTAQINPLGDAQMVRAVAPGGGLVYIGGHDPGSGTPGDLGAWDPVTGSEVWRLPLWFGGGVSSLVVLGQRLFGLTDRMALFVFDLNVDTPPSLVHHAHIPVGVPNVPRLSLDRGQIYGVSSSRVFRIDSITFSVQILVDDLNADWYAGPHLSIDSEHWLYTLTGRDLIRVRDNTSAATTRSKILTTG